jgi:hypothetical protein
MPTNQRKLPFMEVSSPARPPWRNVNPCTGALWRTLPTGLFTTGHIVGRSSHPGVDFTRVCSGTPDSVAESSTFLTQLTAVEKGTRSGEWAAPERFARYLASPGSAAVHRNCSKLQFLQSRHTANQKNIGNKIAARKPRLASHTPRD